MRTLPKGSGRLSCEIGVLACRVPAFVFFLENYPHNNSKNMKIDVYGTMIGRNEQRMLVLDKKMCPDPLEALKPSGDFASKLFFWGRGPGVPSGLPMPYVGSSLICPLRAAWKTRGI